MTRSFSERYGYVPPKLAQVESMDEALRNGLLDIVQRRMNRELVYWHELGHLHTYSPIARYWAEVEKKPLQELAREGAERFAGRLTAAFRVRDWNLVYDIVQWFRDVEDNESVDVEINAVLQRENAGYRVVNGQITPITSPLEVDEVEAGGTGSSSAADHLRRAVTLLKAAAPDFRNAIKEAIQAVEAEVRLTTGKENATLGEALKGARDVMHPALRKAAEGLWGFSSEDGGIRHAKLEGDADPTRDEARFCIVTCSALVNLLRGQRPGRAPP